jgi:hypothetical protein
MSVWSDMEGEMQPLPLDPDTADRLLTGSVAPEDAPPGYGAVVRLLDAASARASAQELAREGDEVRAIAAAVRSFAPPVSTSRRSIMPFAPSRPRVAIAALVAALAATAGMASAGSLPGAAQDLASDILAKLGISVPGPNEHAGGNADVRGKSGSAPSTSDRGKGSDISELATTTDLSGVDKGAAISDAASEGKSRAGEDGNGSNAGENASETGKGSEISQLATSTDLTGVNKGAAISSAASEGKSQAGQHSSGSSSSNGSPPVATPNSGGTGTADTASGGASSQGTSTGDAASGGASAAGSGNAANAPPAGGDASAAGGGNANPPQPRHP